MNSNYELAMKYRNTVINIDDIKSIESNISKECRYYLIGLLAQQEKQRIKSGEATKTAIRKVGESFGYSDASLLRCCQYIRAIANLEKHIPEIIPLIFENHTRLSIENTINLSNKQPDEIRKIIRKLDDKKLQINEIFPEHLSHRPGIRHNTIRKPLKKPESTVKEMPDYDPDAQVSSLTFTVPSWVAAIDKTFMNTNFNEISIKARYKFKKELTALKDTIEIVLSMTMEEH